MTPRRLSDAAARALSCALFAVLLLAPVLRAAAADGLWAPPAEQTETVDVQEAEPKATGPAPVVLADLPPALPEARHDAPAASAERGTPPTPPPRR